mgnify:CR=1 FL=1
MSTKEQLVALTLGVCQKEGLENGINWLLDNMNNYYKDEVERLERKLAVRDKLLFNLQNYGKD